MLAGCKTQHLYTLEYKVISVEIQNTGAGASSHETYIITAENPHSTIRAEGRERVLLGENMCFGGASLFGKKVQKDPCVGASQSNKNYDYEVEYRIVGEKINK